MTTQTERPVPEPRNGVNTTAFFATMDAVKATPAIADFQWRVQSKWLSGTHSRTEFTTFTGAGGEQAHRMTFKADADHPEVLCGEDNGPTPVEYLLHALAACLTSGIANISAARGVDLEEVTSTIEGDMDLQGILGLDDSVRNGFSGIRVQFNIKGNASEEKLRKIVEQSIARSAVYDMLTNGTQVDVRVNDLH